MDPNAIGGQFTAAAQAYANGIQPYATRLFAALLFIEILVTAIQYMTDPLSVFREVHRVLRPGAPFVVAFSNRCFPTKAVAVWLDTTEEQHVELVRAYFEAAGGWVDVSEENRSQGDLGDPLYAVWARTSS